MDTFMRKFHGLESKNIQINQQIDFLNKNIIYAGQIRMSLQSNINTFNTVYSACTNCNQQLLNIPQSPENDCRLQEEKVVHEKQLKTLSLSINNDLDIYVNKVNELLNVFIGVKTHVIDTTLLKWKCEQQLSGNGYKINTNMDSIATWCNKLYDLIWSIRSLIQDADNFKVNLGAYIELPESCGIITSLFDMTTQYLSSVISSSFVITSQPPQVLKTNTKFTIEVRLLLGKKLGIQMESSISPVVNVTIVSETQANEIIKKNKTNGESCGEILNCDGKMEYQHGHVSINFRNLQLKKIKRPRRDTDTVTEEKFSILITSKFLISDDLHLEVWNLSLPIVVIVHGNQEPRACATISWDNAFGQPGRSLFNVPEEVPWKYMSEVLNMKFILATGRGLTKENLTYLAEKAFRMNNVDVNNVFISWSKFCKEPLPHRSFTFWEWFYSIIKLTKEHLKGPWTDGSIIGFINKADAEHMLTTHKTGTFLLRFSDSELGGVTIACAGSNNFNAYSLYPFSAKDLSIRNLSDRLFDLTYLTKLYPDTGKIQAFGKYYTKSQDVNIPITCNGYVKPILVTHVPGLGEPGITRQRMNNYSNTSQSNTFYTNSSDCSNNNSSSMNK